MAGSPKNYSHVFDVFKDRPLNKRQKIFMKIGWLAFTIYFLAQITFDIFIKGRYTSVNIPFIYNQFIIVPATWGFLVGFLMIGVVGIEYVGYAFGKKTFLSALLLVLGKVGKYILLPALLIALLLLPVIIYSYSK